MEKKLRKNNRVGKRGFGGSGGVMECWSNGVVE
jgi:hypothetical protein